MKKVNHLTLLTLLLIIGLEINAQEQDWIDDIQHYRDSVDQVFGDPELSILKPKAVESFKGIDYYAIQSEFKVIASFAKVDSSDYFQMKTTTDRLPEYRVFGTLRFQLGGRKHEIPVYQNRELVKRKGYEDFLFLPFTDETNYEGTYPGGRYLDISSGDIVNGKVELDFNRCYNPYCAYNDRYSCPIPPSENHISVRVEAGVKYHAK